MKLKELQHLVHLLGGDENTEIVFRKQDKNLNLFCYERYKDNKLISQGVFEEDNLENKDVIQIILS